MPDAPENPEVPLAPFVPEKPDVPENPEIPLNPEVPEKPEIPDVPEKPEMPDAPEKPEVPEKPDKPKAVFTEVPSAKIILSVATFPFTPIPPSTISAPVVFDVETFVLYILTLPPYCAMEIQPLASTSIIGRPDISLTEKIVPVKLSVIENNCPEFPLKDIVSLSSISMDIILLPLGLIKSKFDFKLNVLVEAL